MTKKYNILVTGCGGDIGQSIGKILQSEGMFDAVIGCDMSDENAARFIFDKVIKIPACTKDDYVPTLQRVIDDEAIDILLPIAEPELRWFAKNKISSPFLGKTLICANIKSLETGFDKYATTQFLKKSGLSFPETFVLGDATEALIPSVLKSRTGSGSKHVFILEDIIEFDFYKRKYPDFIMQELLTKSDDEYTCGLFRSADGETRSIIYKRKLTGGFSGFGVMEENESIERLLLEIAKGLDLCGSINVQLRLSEKGPCVFEINPRFSSTVMFRHLMGFKDVVWSIQDSLNIPLSAWNKAQAGTKFYKGFNEYIQ